MRLLSVLTFLMAFPLLSLISAQGNCAIPEAQTTLDIHQVMAIAPEPTISQEEVAAIIPTDMETGSDESMVSKQILDRSLKSALKSDLIRKSALVEAADKVKDGFVAEAAIGGEDGGTQHKFRFQYDPFQAKGKIKYSGFFDAVTTVEHLNTVTLQLGWSW